MTWSHAILLGLALINQADAAGRIQVDVLIDGAAPASPCRATAKSVPAGGTVEGQVPGPLSLTPGTHELRVECRRGEDRLTIADSITIRAGQTSSKRVTLTSARLRVIAKRDGALQAATALLLPVNASPDATPLVSHPSNQKFIIAAGTYDVLVHLDAPADRDRATARISSVRIAGDAVREVVADLSDGSLEVAVTENGRAAEGSIRVYRPNAAAQLAHGTAGSAIALRPGPYVVETTLGGAADFPSKRSTVWIEAKKTARLLEKFDTGRLTVGVFKERKPIEATVRLSLPGAEEFFSYFSAPGSVSLTPGLYDVIIAPKDELPLSQLRRPRVSVSRSLENKIAFDLSPARLVVRVRRGGRPADVVDLRVVPAGGGPDAARPEPDGSYRLWPGRYEVVARLPDGDESRDGPFEVGFGESLQRTIDFSRGTLTVHALRGAAVADDAEIFVFRRGAQKPLVQGRPRALLEIPPGTYDVKVVAGTQIEWREDVKVRDGKTTRLDVRFLGSDGGSLPEGDLAPLADELPEGETP